MNFFQRVKAVFTPNAYIEASTRLLEGFGLKGAKYQPFDYYRALSLFHSWAYAAAMIRANAVASVPLRQYAMIPAGMKTKRHFKSEAEWKRAAADGKAMLYGTKPVSPAAKRYFAGRHPNQKPSKSVMRKAAEYGVDVEEIVEPHPCLTVLEQSNEWTNGHQLTVHRILDLQITGNSYLHPVMDRDSDRPATCWRMPPQWTRIIPDKDLFIRGYLYGTDVTREKEFAPDEVIHFRQPNPADIHYGRGWVEAAFSALNLHGDKRTMDLAKFQNMARPDWLISVMGGGPEALKGLKAVLEEKMKGPGKQGQFLAATGDVKATALQWEVPEIGTATRIIEEIAACSGVPVTMLLSNDPTKAGSETSRLAFYRMTVKPDCIDDEQKLNEKWVPLFPDADRMFLCYDHVSFEDLELQAKRCIGLVAGGVWSVNEARAELWYEAADGGDVIYPPSGLTGGGASLGGNIGVGQNDEQGKPKMFTRKATPAVAADEGGDPELEFQRAAYLSFQKDRTAGGILTNVADLGELTETVGIPRGPAYKQPLVPIVSSDGPVVTGEVIRNAAGDIVGGDSEVRPEEVISVRTDAGGKEGAEQSLVNQSSGTGVTNGSADKA